jgi:hypothetical protein
MGAVELIFNYSIVLSLTPYCARKVLFLAKALVVLRQTGSSSGTQNNLARDNMVTTFK